MKVQIKGSSSNENKIMSSQDVTVTLDGASVGKYCQRVEFTVDAREGPAEVRMLLLPSRVLDIEYDDASVYVILDGKKFQLLEVK